MHTEGSIVIRGIVTSFTWSVLIEILENLKGSQQTSHLQKCVTLFVNMEEYLLSQLGVQENLKLFALLVTPGQQIRQVEEETKIVCKVSKQPHQVPALLSSLSYWSNNFLLEADFISFAVLLGFLDREHENLFIPALK